MNPRKCHDLNPRLLVKDQGHYAHNGLNIVRAISFHWKHGLGYFIELLHWTLGSVTAVIQGYWSKVTTHSGLEKYFTELSH
jgi:hypothetical protein